MKPRKSNITSPHPSTTLVSLYYLNMICESCRKFFHWLQGPLSPGSEEFYHHCTWTAWAKAIAEGCILCIRIHQIFQVRRLDPQPVYSWIRYFIQGSKFPKAVLGWEGNQMGRMFDDGGTAEFELVSVKRSQGRISHHHWSINSSQYRQLMIECRSTRNRRLRADSPNRFRSLP